MAKKKVHPRPGALKELLKKREMTQMERQTGKWSALTGRRCARSIAACKDFLRRGPPKFAPHTDPPETPIWVRVNGVWLDEEKKRGEMDDEIPF